MKSVFPLAVLVPLLLLGGAVPLTPAEAGGLSKAKIKKLTNDMVSNMRESNWDAVRENMRELQEADSAKVFKLLVKVVEKSPPYAELDTTLRGAAEKMTSKRVQKEVAKALKRSKSALVRRAMVVHLANQKDWDPLLVAIKDKDERVSSVAAWKLIDARVEAAVVPLIDQLEKVEKDRSGIWDVLRIGLGKMLGQKLNSAIEYRSRWEIVQQEGGLAKVKGAKEAPKSAGDMRSGVRLFGRDIECTRVVFILDISGSMQAIDPDQKDYEDDDLTTGVRKKKTTGPSGVPEKPKGKTRLKRAQIALSKVLKNLPASYKVNIVAYSTHVKLWRAHDGDNPPGLHVLNAKNRAAAIKFVNSFKADGVTATDSALLRGYEVQGARCFYLLSDGFATHDGTTKVETEVILDVLKKHKDRHVIVHTLGFKGADREMMQALAKYSGGRYSDIK